MPGAGGRLLAVQADVASEQDAARLINQTVERFGGLDILINNAGIGRFANIADMSTEDWHAIIGTNLTGVVLLHARGAAAPQAARRRLDHQHQQPGQQERRSPAAAPTARRRRRSTRSPKR